MPISRVNIAGQEKTLFNKLETTTFERAYRAAYVDTQKTDFVSTCKKCWNTFWLHTFGRNGWKAGKIAGVDTLKAERAAIKEYTSKRDILITELAKTKGIVNANWIEEMGLKNGSDYTQALGAQSDKLEDEALPAFYKALCGRVVSLKNETTTTTSQAELYRAGFAQVATKIAEHNKNHKPSAHIFKKFELVVESESKERAIKELASTISFDDLASKGLGAIVDALDLHMKTFGVYEDETDIAKKVFEQVVALHGKECQNEVEIRQNPAYVFEEADKLKPKLKAQLKDARSRMDAHVEGLKGMTAPEREQYIRNEITTILNELAKVNTLAKQAEEDSLPKLAKITEKQKEKLEKQLKNAQGRMHAHTKAHPPKKLKSSEQVRIFEKLYKVAQKEQRIRDEITTISGQLENCQGTVANQVQQEIECLEQFIPNFRRSEVIAQEIVNMLPTETTEEPVDAFKGLPRLILNHYGDSVHGEEYSGLKQQLPAVDEFSGYSNGKTVMSKKEFQIIMGSYKAKYEARKHLSKKIKIPVSPIKTKNIRNRRHDPKKTIELTPL